MATRIFLGLSALIWLPYGVYCFFNPGFLAGAAGVAFISPTGSTELRAMYGGLQAAIGVFAALAVVRPTAVRPALLMLTALTGGLASARLLGALLDGGLSVYTVGGLVLESATVAIGAALLRRVQA